jgi:hypothetical protein
LKSFYLFYRMPDSHSFVFVFVAYVNGKIGYVNGYVKLCSGANA